MNEKGKSSGTWRRTVVLTFYCPSSHLSAPLFRLSLFRPKRSCRVKAIVRFPFFTPSRFKISSKNHKKSTQRPIINIQNSKKIQIGNFLFLKQFSIQNLCNLQFNAFICISDLCFIWFFAKFELVGELNKKVLNRSDDFFCTNLLWNYWISNFFVMKF